MIKINIKVVPIDPLVGRVFVYPKGGEPDRKWTITEVTGYTVSYTDGLSSCTGCTIEAFKSNIEDKIWVFCDDKDKYNSEGEKILCGQKI